MRAFSLFLIFITTTAQAEAPMNAAEFDAYVTGRIVSFGVEDNAGFGVEQYLENRRVIWSRGDGTCTNGVWYESKGNICFRYDGDPEPKCWAIYRDGDGMRAVYATRPNTTVIFETEDYSVPLICDGLSS
jgi:hypothetical protein